MDTFYAVTWKRRLFALQDYSEKHALAVNYEYNTAAIMWPRTF